MGGRSEDTLSGLRFHINDDDNDVHVHDDTKGAKFTADIDDFKKQVGDALQLLNKSDGIIKIEGNSKTSLCLIKESDTLYAMVLNKQGIKKKLEKFLKAC